MSARFVVPAPVNTPCGWRYSYGSNSSADVCQGDRPAVHVLTRSLPVAPAGTALCAYHSPYDVVKINPAALLHVPVRPVLSVPETYPHSSLRTPYDGFSVGE